MKMVARVRAVVDIPFDFDVEEPNETGHTNSRIEAAKHAEGDISKQVYELIKDKGTVVDIMVEQVHESSLA